MNTQSPQTVTNLVERIKEVQRKYNLSDAEFCRRIGIDQSIWSRLKRGKANPSGKFIKGLLREFPELIPDYMDYVRR